MVEVSNCGVDLVLRKSEQLVRLEYLGIQEDDLTVLALQLVAEDLASLFSHFQEALLWVIKQTPAGNAPIARSRSF